MRCKTITPSLDAIADAASHAGVVVRTSGQALPACVDCLRAHLMQVLATAHTDLATGRHHTDAVAAAIAAYAIAVVAMIEDLTRRTDSAAADLAQLHRMYDGKSST